MAEEKPFFAVNFPADSSGCNFYRMLAPRLAVQSMASNLNFTETSRFIADPNWFNDVNLCHLQRQVSDVQAEYYTKFIVPLSQQNGMWVVYNIDDAIGMDDIPKYNSAWEAYQNPQLMKNVSVMMQQSDFIVVTTEYLRNYYITKFGADPDSVLVIPNYLPKWWMGQYYDLAHRMQLYDRYKKRPRLGIIASSTHFDVHNVNGGQDDFTHVIDFIKKTTKKYEWVFVGCVPQQLQPELNSGKITYTGGMNIMNYPDLIGSLDCQAFVQPLEHNEFNRCKSNIKFLEACAMGTPLIAQRMNIYEPYTDLLFDDTEELQQKLNHVLSSREKFKSIVKKQWNELNTGRGGKGWWLENNIEDWMQFYRMTKKCISIDINRIIESENQQKEKEEKEEIIDGLEVVR
jgi:glycosyltransferase involved in cell wall biosynthesis